MKTTPMETMTLGLWMRESWTRCGKWDCGLLRKLINCSTTTMLSFKAIQITKWRALINLDHFFKRWLRTQTSLTPTRLCSVCIPMYDSQMTLRQSLLLLTTTCLKRSKQTNQTSEKLHSKFWLTCFVEIKAQAVSTLNFRRGSDRRIQNARTFACLLWLKRSKQRSRTLFKIWTYAKYSNRSRSQSPTIIRIWGRPPIKFSNTCLKDVKMKSP